MGSAGGLRLGSRELRDDFEEELASLTVRSNPPCQFYRTIDGKLTDGDLSDEGNAFTKVYFDFEVGQYPKDYEEALCRDLPTIYHVPDSWESYEKLKPILDRRFAAWRADRIERQR
jgi:hypothetical protein